MAYDDGSTERESEAFKIIQSLGKLLLAEKIFSRLFVEETDVDEAPGYCLPEKTRYFFLKTNVFRAIARIAIYSDQVETQSEKLKKLVDGRYQELCQRIGYGVRFKDWNYDYTRFYGQTFYKRHPLV